MSNKISKKSVSDQVYLLLKDSILNFNRRPGDKLNIDELCKDFEVSNTPVREALVRLQQDNLVEQRSNYGFYVRSLSKKETIDYSNIIKVMILGSVEELIERNKINDIIPDLEKQLERQKLSFKRKDDASFLKEAITFDQIFIKALDNELMYQWVAEFNEIFSFAVFVFHQGKENKKNSIYDHGRMVEAIRNQDYIGLKKIIRDHYVLGTKDELYLES